MNAEERRRVLIIKAKGGFGNRMLSATTGIVLAELTGRTPVIDWRDGNAYLPAGVNAYPVLFLDPIGIDPIQFDDRRDVVPEIWSGRLDKHPVDLVEEFYPTKHSSPFIYRRLSIDLAHPDEPEDVAVFWSYLPKLARIRRLTRQSPAFRGMSDSDIYREVLARYFSPNCRIRETVEAVSDDWSSPSIGVHVRYTDRKAPLSRIEAAVAKLRASHRDAPIFLATDSAVVEERFRDRFPQVSTIAKSFAQGANLHEEGVFDDPTREAENALADMWALSQCHWLVHSSNSTFSVTAALVGNIPSQRQTDVQHLDLRVAAKHWIQTWA